MGLRDLLSIFRRGDATDATLLDIGKAIAFGSEAEVRTVATAWASRQRDLEEAAAERERHEAAAQWLTERVMRSPGACWMPGDE